MSARRLVLASRNAHKLAEMRALLQPLGWDLCSISEFTDADVDEPAPTYIENALLKARAAARASGLPALADDSGLSVDALGGQPGVRSARYAGDKASDAANVDKLLGALQGVPASQRGACFVSVLALVHHAEDPLPLIAQGLWPGQIAESPRGSRGFGYDPVFVDPDSGLCAAELSVEDKNRRSHRARACARLVELLRDHA